MVAEQQSSPSSWKLASRRFYQRAEMSKQSSPGMMVFLLSVFRSLSTASSSVQPQNMMHVAEEAAYATAFIPATVLFPCNLLCCASW